MPSLPLIFIFIAILLQSSLVENEQPPRLIIWNIGQGQWLTYQDGSYCLHFDLGGDRWNVKKSQIQNLCSKRKNILFLSHSDWDHMSYIRKAQRHLPNLCLYKKPLEKLHLKKQIWLQRLQLCSKTNDHQNLKHSSVQEIHWPHQRLQRPNSNDLSRIFILRKNILIPGDSSKRAERIWVNSATHLSRIRLLILGHHGSLTSSSKALLSTLPQLQVAIASARQQKYGHPHPQILQRLKNKRIPLLRTEDWGHIIIELRGIKKMSN